MNMDSMTEPTSLLASAAERAFMYHYHRDHMNARLHCAPETRFSPITFELAMALVDHDEMNRHTEYVGEVWSHIGKYDLDGGR